MLATSGASQNEKAIDCYVPCVNIDAKSSKVLFTHKEVCIVSEVHL
jgi:hypothetical protein